MNKSSDGYIALISVLVIASVVLTITVTMALVSVSELQSSLAGRKNDDAVNLVEACIEDALIRLNKNYPTPIPTSIPLPEGSCSVTLDSQVGTVWTFTATVNRDGYIKRVQVVANRGSQVTITSWKEL